MICSLVGSGIFLIPYGLSVFSINAIISLVLMTGISAYIGYIFTQSNETSIFKFIENNLGRKIAIVSATFYWILAWSSSIILLNEVFFYLSNLFPEIASFKFIIQVFIIIMIVIFNLYKNKATERAENLMNILKFIILILFPIICFFKSAIKLENLAGNVDFKLIIKGFPHILWSFAGLECGSLLAKEKDAYKSVIVGILITGLIYLLNLIAIFGILGYNLKNPLPFVEIIHNFYGKTGFILLNVSILLINFVGFNSWTIISSEVATLNAIAGYFPKKLLKTNPHNVHFYSLILSTVGLIPLSLLKDSVVRNNINIASNGLFLFYIIFLISYAKKNKSISSIVLIIFIMLYFIP